MNSNEYNGWTNYETWAVNLWMDNEQGSQEYWHGEAKRILDSDELRDHESQIAALADSLKEQHEESLPELTGFAADLLNGAMSEVNWYEIAKHLIEAVQAA